MDWDTTHRRFGLACFLQALPVDPEGAGDAAAFFDKREDAERWAEKAVAAGRYRYLALWDGVSGEWVFVDEFGIEEDG